MTRIITGGRLLGDVSRRGFLSACMLMGRSAVGLGWSTELARGLSGATFDVRDFGAVGDGRTNDTRRR